MAFRHAERGWTVTALACPRCGAGLEPGDRFCAECGVRVVAEVAPAGGRVEAVGPGLAGQTDPGVRHAANQDAFAVSGPGAGGAGTVMVLCDGVSNSQTPELAAATAAAAAHGVLAAGGDAPVAERAAVMDGAVRAAHDAVCALGFDRQSSVDPPATTIVAAWLDAEGAWVGWLGDSRAYVLGEDGRALTRDHSWLALVTERGEMTESEARRDARAHALVHCLGTTDFARPSACPVPGVARVARADGWLVLCSDGLWNYAETAGALAGAAGEGMHGDAADLCGRLVAFARRAGGHDNITVLAARW